MQLRENCQQQARTDNKKIVKSTHKRLFKKDLCLPGFNYLRSRDYSCDKFKNNIQEYRHHYTGMEFAHAHKVAKKKVNAFGLYDMLGNIWEWCRDVWQQYYDNDNTSADHRLWLKEPSAQRVNRGGSFCTRALECRSAHRDGMSYKRCDYSLGFRVAFSLPTVK